MNIGRVPLLKEPKLFNYMKILSIATFLIVIFFTHKSFSQQTIFNVPSADILQKDKVFVQHESQFRAKDPQNFINATNYFAYGAGNNIEIDATLFNLSSPTSKNVALGIGFKSAYEIEALKDYQAKIIFGDMVPFSLQGNGVGNWLYVEPSFYVSQTSTRITGGISYGTKQIFGEEVVCFLGGFEQKVTAKINFIGDWYSGNHALGIFANGFSYQFPRDLTFYAGYQIPNSKEVGRNSFVIEVAKIF